MYDMHLIHSTAAQRLVEDRLREAERLRQVHRTEQQRKAWLRVKRAVELGLRDGLDQRELAHELYTRLGEGVWTQPASAGHPARFRGGVGFAPGTRLRIEYRPLSWRGPNSPPGGEPALHNLESRS